VSEDAAGLAYFMNQQFSEVNVRSLVDSVSMISKSCAAIFPMIFSINRFMRID
jgi:hypothetical protein